MKNHLFKKIIILFFLIIAQVVFSSVETSVTVPKKGSPPPPPPPQCILSLLVSPEQGGQVIGAGTYICGTSLTISAQIELGYEFLHWKEGENIINTSKSFLISLPTNRTLTAVFQEKGYVIVNLQEDLQVLEKETQDDLTMVPQLGTVSSFLKKENKIIAEIISLFDKNLDWQDVKSDISEEKSFLHIPDKEKLGVSSFVLYIPAIKNTGRVYICPGAQSLEGVHKECPNIYLLEREPIEGYYQVEIKNTGGAEADFKDPEITTKAAININTDSAILQGEVLKLYHESADVLFSFREKEKEWIKTEKINIDEAKEFSQKIINLKPDTEYQFFALINYNDKEKTGSILNFRTKKEPEMITKPATSINIDSAVLQGEARYLEEASQAYFFYREQGQNWIQTEKQNIQGSGNISQFVSNLKSNTNYEFYSVLEWQGKQKTGTISSFSTKKEIDLDPDTDPEPVTPGPSVKIDPRIITQPAENLTYYSATLKAELSDNQGQEIEIIFFYKEQGGNWQQTVSQKIIKQGTIEQRIRDLKPETSYDFYPRIRWNNKEKQGEILSFITLKRPVVPVAETLERATQTVRETRERAQEITEVPEVKRTTQTVVTAGAIGGAAVATSGLFANPFVLGEIFMIPLRLWSLLLSALGLKKRYKPWGVVYDSVTKQPLDPAYVLLEDMQGKEIADAFTDLDGRYGFLVPPGQYILKANKTNYAFPSKKLQGKHEDELYPSLYFGEQIQVTQDNQVITKNIPLDPLKFDWNEFAKRDMKVMRFHSRLDKFLNGRIINSLFFLGFFLTLFLFLISVSWYNGIFLGFYLLMIVMRKLGIKPKSSGYITDKNNNPLSYALIRIFNKDKSKEMFKRTTDKLGRYYCLVPPGEYILVVEKKQEDESYYQVLETRVQGKKGIINFNLEV